MFWGSTYILSRGLLELPNLEVTVRVLIALAPVPVFIWFLWTWMKGLSEMDELQRRIELEALAFAFPIAVIAAHDARTDGAGDPAESGRLELSPRVGHDARPLLRGPMAREEALSVKNRLKVLRAERDWSQQDLAYKLAVSRQTINAIETEKYDPSLPLALKIGRLFDQCVEKIFSLEDVQATEARRRGAK